MKTILSGIKLMPNIRKQELIDRIAGKTESKRMTVKAVIQQFLDEIIAELAQGNRLEFRDFGVFEPRIREARTAQNPKTLEKVQVPANRSVKFKMGRGMRERLNGV
jgi:integration host factor subunit beta